jgi:heptosyltransferase I
VIERILIVRLSALGDIIHALPAAAALREAFPTARIDWLVSERHRAILEHVGPVSPNGAPVIDHRIVLERRTTGSPLSAMARKARAEGLFGAWARGAAARRPPGRGPRRPSDDDALPLTDAVGAMRKADYDVAFDFQGLMKSAMLARSSGARRVVGFSTDHLRERWAHLFYTETVEPPPGVHVIDKNLALLRAVGLRDVEKKFPALVAGEALRLALAQDTRSGQAGVSAEAVGAGGAKADAPFALINPGAGWPNKRWPPEWFGDLARRIRSRHGIDSLVLWGPNEEMLARMVVDSSHGAARLAPLTGVGEMIGLVQQAALFVSGDTGPLHIAAACGTPIVGLYGPTSPARNGPWRPEDVSVSRFESCECHHRRRCRREVGCLLDIGVDEVMAAVDRRLGGRGTAGCDSQ